MSVKQESRKRVQNIRAFVHWRFCGKKYRNGAFPLHSPCRFLLHKLVSNKADRIWDIICNVLLDFGKNTCLNRFETAFSFVTTYCFFYVAFNFPPAVSMCDLPKRISLIAPVILERLTFSIDNFWKLYYYSSVLACMLLKEMRRAYLNSSGKLTQTENVVNISLFNLLIYVFIFLWGFMCWCSSHQCRRGKVEGSIIPGVMLSTGMGILDVK